ncbi:MAG TPA: DUF4388 domain-containing protein [Dictyoglomaceae bacterium]|nr:DUF4388 domain-containing protein [Dictyoglomaceae bacterium]
MGLRGDLVSLPFFEVLQLLSSGKKTGKLQIEKGNKKAEIVFNDGRITYAKSGLSEYYEALMDLSLWERGSFVFVPGEVSMEPVSIDPVKLWGDWSSILHVEQDTQTPTQGLDPFNILLAASKYLDMLHYFKEAVFIPVDNQNLNSSEDLVFPLFNGIKKLSEIIDSSELSAARILETTKSLYLKNKILKWGSDEKLFWILVFISYWDYAIERFPKMGVSERDLRGKLQSIISQGIKIREVIEKVTSSRNRDYVEINGVIKGMSFEEIKKEVKIILSTIISLKEKPFNSVLELGKSLLDNINLDEYMDKTLVRLQDSDSTFESTLLLKFFDGVRTLKDIFDDSIFDEMETRNLVVENLKTKRVFDVSQDKKISLTHRFWSTIYKAIKISYEEKTYLLEFFENSFSDLKSTFQFLTIDSDPNWNYVISNLSKIGEEEVLGFVKDTAEFLKGKNYSEDLIKYLIL